MNTIFVTITDLKQGFCECFRKYQKWMYQFDNIWKDRKFYSECSDIHIFRNLDISEKKFPIMMSKKEISKQSYIKFTFKTNKKTEKASYQSYQKVSQIILFIKALWKYSY